jgi:hypothetical protein
MNTLKRAANCLAPILPMAVLLMSANATFAQNAIPSCSTAGVIPLTASQPAPKLVIGQPLAGPLAARGVVVIPYCAENMRIVPVFGAGALEVSPRVGHIHVTVDDTPWHWADASGTPVILQALSPGPHRVLIELADANHQIVDKGTITFEVPKKD